MLQRGLAGMNFTFFWVQLASMIAGWTAVYALRDDTGVSIANQQSIFGRLALMIKTSSNFGDFASSMMGRQALVMLTNTAANKKPKTTRQTTVSSGLAKAEAVMIRGNEPQMR